MRIWLKFKNPAAPAVKREAEEGWGEAEVTLAHVLVSLNQLGRSIDD